MEDQAALIARRVALAAAAWFNEPGRRRGLPPARRRGEWNAYTSSRLEAGDVDELLDDLADVAPPTQLGHGVAELEAVLRRQARREL